eukprot:snap_masked-scaffold_81-processed-gene-0.23-mRNA-1 protein AED:1.00 eAED:1.00 QI:0/0/0/0/1/1/3/0/74
MKNLFHMSRMFCQDWSKIWHFFYDCNIDSYERTLEKQNSHSYCQEGSLAFVTGIKKYNFKTYMSLLLQRKTSLN